MPGHVNLPQTDNGKDAQYETDDDDDDDDDDDGGARLVTVCAVATINLPLRNNDTSGSPHMSQITR